MKKNLRRFREIKNKEKFLKDNAIFEVNINDKRHCIHCGQDFFVKDYKVEIVYMDIKDIVPVDFIVCPNAPNCDGTMIDWVTTEE